MPAGPTTGASANAESAAGAVAGNGQSAGLLPGVRGHSPSPQSVERRTKEIGRELFERIGRGPKPWQRAWWEDRFIAATLDDPLVRVQLFRFIDALAGAEDRRGGPPTPGRVSGRGG